MDPMEIARYAEWKVKSYLNINVGEAKALVMQNSSKDTTFLNLLFYDSRELMIRNNIQ